MLTRLAVLACAVNSGLTAFAASPSAPPAYFTCPQQVQNQLCSTSSPPGDCQVTADLVWGNGWCSWAGSGTLTVSPNVTIACKQPATNNKQSQCSIALNFEAGIFLEGGSRISASSVRLRSRNGTVTISAGASVDSDAAGRCGYGAAADHGTYSGDPLRGAGHAGFGGSCGPLGGKPYGDSTDVECWSVRGVSNCSGPTADPHTISDYWL